MQKYETSRGGVAARTVSCARRGIPLLRAPTSECGSVGSILYATGRKSAADARCTNVADSCVLAVWLRCSMPIVHVPWNAPRVILRRQVCTNAVWDSGERAWDMSRDEAAAFLNAGAKFAVGPVAR